MPGPARFRMSRIVLVLAGVLVVVAIVLGAVIGAGRDVASYPPDRPEAVAQEYLQALTESRWHDAVQTFSPALVERCGSSIGADFARPRIVHAVLLDTVIAGTQARVRVSITVSSGGDLFTGGESTTDETLVLGRTGSLWRITDVPWPLYACPVKVGP